MVSVWFASRNHHVFDRCGAGVTCMCEHSSSYFQSHAIIRSSLSFGFLDSFTASQSFPSGCRLLVFTSSNCSIHSVATLFGQFLVAHIPLFFPLFLFFLKAWKSSGVFLNSSLHPGHFNPYTLGLVAAMGWKSSGKPSTERSLQCRSQDWCVLVMTRKVKPLLFLFVEKISCCWNM